jgi:hypothetical protein
MAMEGAQHVICRAPGRWAVRKSGASKASKMFTSRRDAIVYARDIARRHGTEVYVHREDGTVSEHVSYDQVLSPARVRKDS